MTDKSSKLWVDAADFSAIQYIGERSSQEDYSQFRLFPSDTGLLAILADGMGGHTSGEVASSTAVNTFDSLFKSYSISSPVSKLAASLSGANAELAKVIVQNPRLKGMGCTLIGVYFNASGMHWISVGDSLIYLYRDGKLNQVNQDHSMAPLIDAPDKPLSLYQGDIVIIASDGILSLNNSEIREVIAKSRGNTAELITNNLIKAVKLKKRRNQDNTTIQVIKATNLYPGKFSRKLFARIALLVTTLLIVSFGSIYHTKLYDLFGPALGFKQEVSEEIKPLAIPANVEQKNDAIPTENNKKNNVGGGIDQQKSQKNDKKKEDSKKIDKKSSDGKGKNNNEKESVPPAQKFDGKGGLEGNVKPESINESDKKSKDQADPKVIEKSESTKI